MLFINLNILLENLYPAAEGIAISKANILWSGTRLKISKGSCYTDRFRCAEIHFEDTFSSWTPVGLLKETFSKVLVRFPRTTGAICWNFCKLCGEFLSSMDLQSARRAPVDNETATKVNAGSKRGVTVSTL